MLIPTTFLGLLPLVAPTETPAQGFRSGPLHRVLVEISVQPSHLTLHEPVLLNLTIANDDTDVAHVDLGRDRKEGLLVDIKSPSGNRVPLSWPRHSGFSRTGDFEVGVNERYTQSYVLNEAYNFDAVGLYEVEVRLAKPVLVNGAASTGQENSYATIEIEPRNELALQKRCETILAQIEDSSSYERAAEGALALSYVKDPVAVPYLQKLLGAKKLVEPIAIGGLENIANSEAVRALSSVLQMTENNTSVLAKAALLRMESESSDPEVKEEIHRVIKKTENPHS